VETTIPIKRFTGSSTCGCCGPTIKEAEHAEPASAAERGKTTRQVSQLSTGATKADSTCDCGCEETPGCECGCECCGP
jgi:hypothetical protein